MQLNTKPVMQFTHEGARAQRINILQQLRRSVMSCMLFEDNFYESGQSVADRIKILIPQVDPKDCYKLAIEARERMNLRHVPLLIVREMARHKTHRQHVARTLERIIQRPDELCDFVALYWKDGKQPLAAKVKQGLARAFVKFNEYQLAKHAHDTRAVKLRDVLFLCHAKPQDEAQTALWKRLIAGELATPDTWEVALSSGADKKATWERLLNERKLGAMAFLRNLRNMEEVQVEKTKIVDYGTSVKLDRVLPYRFIAAAKAAPSFEPMLEQMLYRSIADLPKFDGKTILLIDVSGSMGQQMSGKSEMTYLDAACALAILAREQCGPMDCEVYTFANNIKKIPPRRGFALRDAIMQGAGGGTDLRLAMQHIAKVPHNRLIVITDEQSNSRPDMPTTKSYLINVAPYKNGIGYHNWVHIDGFSAATLEWIKEFEREL